MKAIPTKSTIAAIMSVAFLSVGVMAQQTGDIRPKPLTATVVSNATATVPPTTASASESSERERLLLDRIEKLERRLAELEVRSANKTGETKANKTTLSPTVSEKSETKTATQGTPAQPAGLTSLESKTDSSTQPQRQLVAAGPSTSSSQTTEPKKKEPFAFADFTWLTGNSRQKEYPLKFSDIFTGELRVDAAFHHYFNHPNDNTIGGSTEVFRSGEVQLTDLAVGGDFNYKNVRGRLLTQFGMYSQTQPRNDASPGRGQWNLDNAYRYVSEAYGGYHIDKMNGINVDAGIFLSYIGLDSFYQFDNWSYQPSYVSSNTPWYFQGVRIQIFTSDKLKIEPWIINGWQSYGKFNKAAGVGGQVLWRPNGSVSIVANNYWGTDTLGNPDRKRIHTDDSIQVKYLDRPQSKLSKAAFTFTVDAGCEYGGGVSCNGGTPDKPSQYFLGFMAYNRFWFHKDLFALTLGGGAITTRDGIWS